MKNLWNRAVNAAVASKMPLRTAAAVRSTNATALLLGLWLLAVAIGTSPVFSQSSPDLTLANLGAALALLGVPLIHRRVGTQTAGFTIVVVCLGVVTFNSLHLGRESWNHLFLLATILIAFHYMTSFRLLVISTVLGLSLFLAVETWYAVGLPVLMMHPAPPVVYDVARNATMYNLIGLTVGLAFSRFLALRATQDGLDAERARSEELLLNILPLQVAERLKAGQGAIADQISEATIVFADLVGFTPLAKSLPASALVTLLNEVFIGFDRSAKSLGLEKIKTIGDAYMVAAGIPTPSPDHAQAAIRMAKAMLGHIEGLRNTYPGLHVRIGIHTGPVVAGVIGESKFAYDLWGETVNIASRLESHGVPDRIHVSEAVARAVGDAFEFEEAVEKELKGQGKMITALVRA